MMQKYIRSPTTAESALLGASLAVGGAFCFARSLWQRSGVGVEVTLLLPPPRVGKFAIGDKTFYRERELSPLFEVLPKTMNNSGEVFFDLKLVSEPSGSESILAAAAPFEPVIPHTLPSWVVEVFSQSTGGTFRSVGFGWREGKYLFTARHLTKPGSLARANGNVVLSNPREKNTKRVLLPIADLDSYHVPPPAHAGYEYSGYDIQAIIVPDAAWASLGVKSATNSTYTRKGGGNLTIYGRPESTLYSAAGAFHDNEKARVLESDLGLFFHTANSKAGFSGSPVCMWNNGVPKISGMHVAGVASGEVNAAVSAAAVHELREQLGLVPSVTSEQIRSLVGRFTGGLFSETKMKKRKIGSLNPEEYDEERKQAEFRRDMDRFETTRKGLHLHGLLLDAEENSRIHGDDDEGAANEFRHFKLAIAREEEKYRLSQSKMPRRERWADYSETVLASMADFLGPFSRCSSQQLIHLDPALRDALKDYPMDHHFVISGHSFTLSQSPAGDIWMTRVDAPEVVPLPRFFQQATLAATSSDMKPSAPPPSDCGKSVAPTVVSSASTRSALSRKARRTASAVGCMSGGFESNTVMSRLALPPGLEKQEQELHPIFRRPRFWKRAVDEPVPAEPLPYGPTPFMGTPAELNDTLNRSICGDLTAMSRLGSVSHDSVLSAPCFAAYREYLSRVSIPGGVSYDAPGEVLPDSHGKPCFSKVGRYAGAFQSSEESGHQPLPAEFLEVCRRVGHPLDDEEGSKFWRPPSSSTRSLEASLRAQSAKQTRVEEEVVEADLPVLSEAFGEYTFIPSSLESDDVIKSLNDLIAKDNGSKSSGWTGRHTPGPKSIWQDDQDLKELLIYLVMCRTVLRVVNYQSLASISPEVAIAKGLVDPRVGFIKDEPHARKKKLSKAWRIIWNVSYVDQLCQRLVHNRRDKQDIEDYLVGKLHSQCVGMGHHDDGIAGTARRIRKLFSLGSVVSSDASGWDLSVGRTSLFLDLERRLVRADDIPIVRTLLVAEACMNSCHVIACGRNLWRSDRFGITASGVPSTSAQNSAMRQLLAKLCGARATLAMGDDLLHVGEMDYLRLSRFGVITKGTPEVFTRFSDVEFTSHLYSEGPHALFNNFEKLLAHAAFSGPEGPCEESLRGMRFAIRNDPWQLRTFNQIVRELGWGCGGEQEQ